MPDEPQLAVWTCEHVRAALHRGGRPVQLGSEHILVCAECWHALQNEALRDLADEVLLQAGREVLLALRKCRENAEQR